MLRSSHQLPYYLKIILATVLFSATIWFTNEIKTQHAKVTPTVNDAEFTKATQRNYSLSGSSDLFRQGNVNHKFRGAFNLIEDTAPHTGTLERPIKECSLELMNTERLQQDHPCVLNNIRKHFLKPPAASGEPLHLYYPEVVDPSDGQAEAVLYLLKNKTNGFFIECGALDGENLSNTLYLERFLNWTGVLIEADQATYKHLYSRKRKSWSAPVCLSDDPYPQQVTFRAIYAHGQIMNDKVPMRNLSGHTGGYGRVTTVQCFPLYSVLLAIGQTDIDYFSLDVEEHDLLVLKTIPFNKVNITVLSVELLGWSEEMKAKRKETIEYMKLQGYDPFYPASMPNDVIFAKREFLKKNRFQQQIS